MTSRLFFCNRSISGQVSSRKKFPVSSFTGRNRFIPAKELALISICESVVDDWKLPRQSGRFFFLERFRSPAPASLSQVEQMLG